MTNYETIDNYIKRGGKITILCPGGYKAKSYQYTISLQEVYHPHVRLDYGCYWVTKKPNAK